ncbi:outer membrane protein assembly factor BamE [Arenimonas oryziterrae]|nr:outer membrane protein assembly factor BamE [Arenimonas oryziterrae]
MRKALLLILSAVLVSGCNWVYRQPVYQGNLLEQKYVEQLKEGMSRQQVETLLGTPPVSDPFHQERWDYVATERYKRNPTEVKNLTVWFENDQVSKWEGEYFPDHNEALLRQAQKFGNLPKDKDKDKKGR